MNISATQSGTSATPTVAEKPAATAAVAAAALPASSADTATISDAGNAAFAAFEASFKQVQNAVSSYGHQVTWELNHHVAVTGPTGTAVTPVATTSVIGAQLVNTQVTIALATQVSLQVPVATSKNCGESHHAKLWTDYTPTEQQHKFS